MAAVQAAELTVFFIQTEEGFADFISLMIEPGPVNCLEIAWSHPLSPGFWKVYFMGGLTPVDFTRNAKCSAHHVIELQIYWWCPTTSLKYRWCSSHAYSHGCSTTYYTAPCHTVNCLGWSLHRAKYLPLDGSCRKVSVKAVKLLPGIKVREIYILFIH